MLLLKFILATYASRLVLSLEEETEYFRCPDIWVSEVGFNYVRFKGKLFRARAIEFSREDGELELGWPMFDRFQNEIVSEPRLRDGFPGLVPLMKADGFKANKWYVVCGMSAPNGGFRGEGCEVCAVVRFCDCWCNVESRRFLRITASKVAVGSDWNTVGFNMTWMSARGLDYPLSLWLNTFVRWDPFDCDKEGSSTCRRPRLVKFNRIPPIHSSDLNFEPKVNTTTFVLNNNKVRNYHLSFDVALDVGELRRAFPQFNLPDQYNNRFGPFHFKPLEKRREEVNHYLPYPNKRLERHTRAMCEKILAFDTDIVYSEPLPSLCPPSPFQSFFLYLSTLSLLTICHFTRTTLI